ncbi:methyltransferase-like protein [Anaeramoeba flamelloides]|uniref:Methyltransferase-like protein n=1 Tax=Anaeramoeba flamelloides TaxID=1746091 RepID=A0ABQ8YA24_9EUKA|nr:methyltransferase-like protein [Anaeramoeba flamelloides]
MIKLKQFESILQQVKDFEEPKIKYEQYCTNSHLASHILYNIATKFGFEEKSVIDLGCGTGMLTIGCSILGANQILSVEIDPNALEIAKENISDLIFEDSSNSEEEEDGDEEEEDGAEEEEQEEEEEEEEEEQEQEQEQEQKEEQNSENEEQKVIKEIIALDDITLVECDVFKLTQKEIIEIYGEDIRFDCAILNPPFGTKIKGVDVKFVTKALEFIKPGGSVFSFHKTTTRKFLIKHFTNMGYNVDVLFQVKFDLPKSYKFHRKKNVEIMVDILHITKK